MISTGRTYVGQNGTVVARLIFVLLVGRSSHYLVPILLVLAVGALELENFYLAGSSVQTRTTRQTRLDEDPERHALLAAVFLRRKLRAYAVHLEMRDLLIFANLFLRF